MTALYVFQCYFFGIFVLKNSTFVIGYQSLPSKKAFGIFFYRGHKQDALQQREIY